MEDLHLSILSGSRIEPFRNIRGQEYRERVRDLVVQLAEELGVQFIINIDTDVYPEFELGKVIRL